MILFFLLSLVSQIDSLKIIFQEEPKIEILKEISRYYLLKNEFDSAFYFLETSGKNLNREELPQLLFLMGEVHLFAGKILDAREQYLRTVARFSNNEIANDALERLYLIEMTKSDTLLLKRIAKPICLYQVGELKNAEESLKELTGTGIGDFALYYCALIYDRMGDPKLALKTLEELNKNFPGHKIYNSIILRAEIQLKLKNKKEAQRILEELIVKEPNSVYSIRAKRLLEKILNKREE